MISTWKFPTLQAAWEGLNEHMVLETPTVLAKAGYVGGNQVVSYNNHVIIHKAWVDPEFDYGRVLGYTDKKWSSLISNYVDMPALELIRGEIALRTAKNAPAYNYTMHFTNAHLSGKDCLISLTFSKRYNRDNPVVSFHARVSELTKRVIFDFLLVQRIVEYIYGHNDVEIHYSTPSFYLSLEAFTMYQNHRDIRELYKAKGILEKPPTTFQKKVLEKLSQYQVVDPLTIKYKSHRRAALQLQFNKDGTPLSNKKALIAKDLTLKLK